MRQFLAHLLGLDEALEEERRRSTHLEDELTIARQDVMRNEYAYNDCTKVNDELRLMIDSLNAAIDEKDNELNAMYEMSMSGPNSEPFLTKVRDLKARVEELEDRNAEYRMESYRLKKRIGGYTCVISKLKKRLEEK